ncbi:hypothetical protein BRADI_4g02470v3 [Brachypodium distachyon]|uniref:Uncharacterized protein n=1 Tax=Brachypodium distachyon TaxID=15368 RepID=A0A2K2CK24_BRADI|nr:hypothetical protein BRADI_4g02470v3 [Brachypodium distachyon]
MYDGLACWPGVRLCVAPRGLPAGLAAMNEFSPYLGWLAWSQTAAVVFFLFCFALLALLPPWSYYIITI